MAKPSCEAGPAQPLRPAPRPREPGRPSEKSGSEGALWPLIRSKSPLAALRPLQSRKLTSAGKGKAQPIGGRPVRSPAQRIQPEHCTAACRCQRSNRHWLCSGSRSPLQPQPAPIVALRDPCAQPTGARRSHQARHRGHSRGSSESGTDLAAADPVRQSALSRCRSSSR